MKKTRLDCCELLFYMDIFYNNNIGLCFSSARLAGPGSGTVEMILDDEYNTNIVNIYQ